MTSSFPGISVLMPVFMRDISWDAIRLLRAALESVHAQKHAGPLEILIIDDGSPTPVESLESELGTVAKHVNWLRLPANVGIVGALNAGLAAARYELIARLDADDSWMPGKLDAQLALMLADPDLTITATGMERVKPSGAQIDVHVRPGNWSGILNFFVEGGCPFPHGSVLAQRRVYMLLGGYSYNADVRHCEDYALWGTWLRFFKPAMVERPLYRYLVSGGSVSTSHAEQQGRASQVVRRRFAELGLAKVLPEVLPELADALGAPLIDAGRLAHALWNYGGALAVPKASLAPLGAMLPDRVLLHVEGAQRWHKTLRVEQGNDADMVAIVAKPFR